MIENTRGETWSIREIIEALSLDWHRARALTCLLLSEKETADGTNYIVDALSYLKALQYDSSLIINAVAMSAAPSDPDKAIVMTAEAVLKDFNISRMAIAHATLYILHDPKEYLSVAQLHEQLGFAIETLEYELKDIANA